MFLIEIQKKNKKKLFDKAPCPFHLKKRVIATYDKFETKGFITNYTRQFFYSRCQKTDIRNRSLCLNNQTLIYSFLSNLALQCSYDVLRFWPNLSQNDLMYEVLIKKNVYRMFCSIRILLHFTKLIT